MRRTSFLIAILTVGLVVLGCLSACTRPPRVEKPTTPRPSMPAPETPEAGETVECTPTAPNGSTPPGEEPSDTFFGNGELWTTLWEEGTVIFEPGGAGEIRPDGTLVMKWPFFRGEAARGQLTVTGRRLDGPAATMTAEIPEGYGDVGFQATGLVFPGEGCWEVTARSGDASLTFVTRVVLRR